MIPSPSEFGAEEIVGNAVLWIKLAVEAIGALVIGAGMSLAAWRVIAGFPPAVVTFADVRLTLARFLAVALEFQLGADILSTAVAPTWDAIGKLAAVYVVGLFGFIIWFGLIISWLFFGGVRPPLLHP